ncbi:MAG: CAP domain-containing protein [Pararhodobacter sp.]
MPSPLLPAIAALATLAACTTAGTPMRMGPDGRPIPVVYRISAAEVPRVQVRMRDAINTVRAQQGLAPVELNAELTSAAATHARDMALQGRPWHFGSDGSSPIDRVQRVGYGGHFLGELISETFETELETLTAWLEQRETRTVLLEPRMREIGFAWHQEANGKLWWTLTTGTPRDIAIAGR